MSHAKKFDLLHGKACVKNEQYLDVHLCNHICPGIHIYARNGVQYGKLVRARARHAKKSNNTYRTTSVPKCTEKHNYKNCSLLHVSVCV